MVQAKNATNSFLKWAIRRRLICLFSVFAIDIIKKQIIWCWDPNPKQQDEEIKALHVGVPLIWIYLNVSG